MTIGDEGSKRPEPVVGGQRPSGPNRTMTAIVAILVVIIVVMSVLYLTKPTSSTAPSVNQSVSGDLSATVGTPFHYTVNVGTSFKTVQVFFGDGSSVTVPYSGSNYVNVTHTYMQPGQGIVSYQVTYNNGATAVAAGNLYPIKVLASATTVSNQQSLGVVNYNYGASSPSIASGQPVFKVGSFVNFTVGYFGEPANSSYQIVMQNISVSYGSGKEYSMPYNWNDSQQMYLAGTHPDLNFTFNNSGVYSVNVITYTAEVNGTTGKILSPLSATSYFYNVAIFDNGAISGVSTSGVFTRVATTPYDSLDPAIGYGVNDYQITLATYQTLVTWNGSHSTQFKPELASQLPSTSNGEINTNYANYTRTYMNGAGVQVTYNVNITPGENYTFQIRNNATWQDGTPVTAWDVMYSFTRTLLFDQGSPGTPGWILAQYLLPGGKLSANTFYNITQNMTVDNSSNSITLHFQVPMSTDLAFNLVAAIGSQITSASWLEAHGAGITWNASGFQAYQSHGLVANYLTYPQNHVMSDGPFEIAYIVPSSEVVLVPNPHYVAPGPWMPKATVSKVILMYTSQISSMQLMMQSGQANSAAIPSANWQGVQSLQAQGKANVYNFTMLGIYYFSYNMNINITGMHKFASQANVPQYLFTNLTARRAFSYSFDYSYYISHQVGNAIYGIDFASEYAGMLPKGMLGYQSIADLNASTGGQVPYFNLQVAKQNWNNLVNGTFNKNSPDPITWSPSQNEFLYNGHPLSIPIAIFAGIPQEVAGASTWESYLQQVIPGITLPQLVLSANIVISATAPNGGTPWPIWSATWYPDYPYPSDYLGPMAEPTNNTFIPGPNSFTPYTLTQTGHINQAANATAMVNWYEAGYYEANTTQALVYFHKMNAMLVNMTAMLFLEQLNGFWVMSPNVNGTYVNLYQSNLMYSSGGDLLLNWIRMNTTS
ncbi:hypothetical protein IX51_09145 [uncultured archaeon]|nr:hypothetical protein IX51_09145 [uncultured archaeon]